MNTGISQLTELIADAERIVAFTGAGISTESGIPDFRSPGGIWWWDIALHGGSAVGFGLVGFVAVFMMFQGDRFAAPHIAVCFFSMCFAVFIGTMWEIFEFAMDTAFGLNMQKSGLRDTMGDLIVDVTGAFLGATVGYLYLRGRENAFLASLIAEFVDRNPRFFGKAREKRPTNRM